MWQELGQLVGFAVVVSGIFATIWSWVAERNWRENKRFQHNLRQGFAHLNKDNLTACENGTA